MDRDRCREAISARLDSEDPPAGWHDDATEVHLAGVAFLALLPRPRPTSPDPGFGISAVA